MPVHELAQLNIGVIKAPMDSPVMADFAANLDRINALAGRTHGFVWRLQTEAGATAVRPFDDENMKGPTAAAFTFRQAFPAPGRSGRNVPDREH